SSSLNELLPTTDYTKSLIWTHYARVLDNISTCSSAERLQSILAASLYFSTNSLIEACRNMGEEFSLLEQLKDLEAVYKSKFDILLTTANVEVSDNNSDNQNIDIFTKIIRKIKKNIRLG
ncbi:MAG: hypothetical protein K2W94_07700, partial [Alphaproteobacteria bacterium]|nr:hypothetical protein [Alphaproteobacteria bacterium]